MSIMSLVQENLNKRSKVTNFRYEKHAKLLNILFSNNKDDVLNLKNNVEAETLIKLAPSWDLINNFEEFKQLGLTSLDEMKLFTMIESKTTIQNEEDRNWLISLIPHIIEFPPHEEDMTFINLNHLKSFARTFIENDGDEKRDEKSYLPEFLSNPNLSNFSQEEIDKVLSLIKHGNTLLSDGMQLFTFLMERMNHVNVIELIEQFIEEDKGTHPNEIYLESFDILFYLNDMNIQNIDLKNLRKKCNELKENKYFSINQFDNAFLIKPFIPFFKEGNDLSVMNEDLLFNLKEAYDHILLKEIIMTYAKNKTFQKTMREYLTTEKGVAPCTFFHYWFVEFENEKFRKLINVNQLTLDELTLLLNKKSTKNIYYNHHVSHDSIMDYLLELKVNNEIKNLTNKEVILHIEKNHVEFSKFFFDNFKNEKIDTRVTLFKFLNSMNLTANLKDLEFMNKFKTKVKELKNPINMIHFYKEFNSKNVDKNTAFSLYVLKTKSMDHLIEEAITEQDFIFILKNRNQLNYFASLLENKKDFIMNSELIKTYFEKMNISEEFKMKYFENILDFYQKGNIESTTSYLLNVSSQQQIKNIGLLVKAELAGKLDEIKYNKEDLRKELASNISDEMIEKWINESSKQDKKFLVKETSDFKTLFEMGENPTRSCMSHVNGAYNECLLSIFDGNKKLITVYENDKLIGRAILRLTKITDENVLTKESNHLEFGFRDIETDGYINPIKDDSEKTVLFLERLYTSYTGSQLHDITKIILDLLKEKATDMELPLYLSSGYNLSSLETKKVETNMFISHSKNGKQYLDSLGGSANSSVGGTYKKANITQLI